MMFLGKFKFSKKTSEDPSSEFSRFFRNASSGEKRKVFMDVAQKASADQRRVFKDGTPAKTA